MRSAFSVNTFLAYDILGTARVFSRYYANLIDNTNDSFWLRIYTVYCMEILNLPIRSTLSFCMKLFCMEWLYRAESLWRAFQELMEGGSYFDGLFEAYA